MKTNQPDFRSLLGDLEGPIHDLRSMTSVTDALWDQMLRSKKTDDGYFTITLNKNELDRFGFAICDLQNRCDSLQRQWDDAVDGKAMQP